MFYCYLFLFNKLLGASFFFGFVSLAVSSLGSGVLACYVSSLLFFIYKEEVSNICKKQ